MNTVVSENDKSIIIKIERLGKEMEMIKDDSLTLKMTGDVMSLIKKLENKNVACAIVDGILDEMWSLNYPLGSPEWDICFDIKHKLAGLKYDIVKSMS